MASANPFDLLVDDDTDDVSQLIAKKALAAPPSAPPSQQQQPKQAKSASKSAPPAQAVKEVKTEGRGGGRGGGRISGRGRGAGGGGGYNRDGAGFNRDGAGFNRDGAGFNRDGASFNKDGAGFNRDGAGGFNRDRVNKENSFSNNGVSGGYAPTEDGDVEKVSRGVHGGSRSTFRGRRGAFNNGEVEPRRFYDRHSGTGRGNDLKREGSGKGNWGSANDEIVQDTEELGNANEKSLTPEKQPEEEVNADASKENPVNEPEEKEAEEKEMTLDEYEKILEEKRKALQALKVEERKVPVDKEFESMQQLSGKKSNNDIFIKLGSDKDKKKEIADKDEKAKKSVSINEFLKPAGGEKYYSPGGRGRGRGRGGRGGAVYSGGSSSSSTSVAAPSIADPGEFPNLK